MALQSSLFAGDLKLEAAAVSDAAHVTPGSNGSHVRKIQQALNMLDGAGLAEDGIYGSGTADAVLAYKQARGIINRSYQTQADNIAGRMTIAAMDRELLAPEPAPEPPVVIIGTPAVHPILAFSFNAPAGAPSTAKFSAVVRGNPYVRANAQFAGLPPSIPPGHSYEVEVTVLPALTGDDFIDLEITGVEAKNGGALVRPPKIQKSTRAIVLGFQQTEPGNAGKLKIQASLNGQVLATSDGFSVCAHPSGVTCTLKGRINDGTHTGIVARASVESDSGSLNHLDQASWSEIVNEIDKTSPPYPAKELTVQDEFLACTAGAFIDEHGSVLRPGAVGILRLFQVYAFKCNRCGAGPVSIANAGFEIFAEVKKVGREFQQVVRKTGKAVSVLGPASMRRNGKTPIFKSTPGNAKILGDPETITEK